MKNLDVASSPTVRRIVGPTILLSSGNYFDFDNPEGSIFTIQDVARGLSNICRFTGHVPFYSVAQHCVLMSWLVPKEHALAALLHDATEAFIGEMTRPLKKRCHDYRTIEGRIEPVILDRFGVTLPFHPCILEADDRMQMTEQHQLKDNQDDWGYPPGTQPYDIMIIPWLPDLAMMKFLNRYDDLKA